MESDKNDTNELLYKTERDKSQNQTWLPRGNMGGSDRLGED